MKYILYARKSTEDDDKQILSIEAQIFELKEFAAKEKLEIVGPTFVETKTAKEPGRMKFAEMLSFLESGKAEGILSWHPDRLARNSVDGGKIIHLVDRGVIKGLKFPCFWFEPTPQGLFMLNIAFGQSKYFADNLRENVKRGLRQKIRRGEWPGRPPVGYINNLATKKIEIDKIKAPKIRKFFELYSTGNYTFQSLANWCHENKLTGFWDKPFSISSSQRTLQNIFYIGRPEGINTLGVVPHYQYIIMRRGKLFNNRRLDFVGVLILIHQNIVELLGVFAAHRFLVKQHQKVGE
jgi:DNA invertase Pin-like site-specific DNA recombinase